MEHTREGFWHRQITHRTWALLAVALVAFISWAAVIDHEPLSDQDAQTSLTH